MCVCVQCAATPVPNIDSPSLAFVHAHTRACAAAVVRARQPIFSLCAPAKYNNDINCVLEHSIYTIMSVEEERNALYAPFFGALGVTSAMALSGEYGHVYIGPDLCAFQRWAPLTPHTSRPKASRPLGHAIQSTACVHLCPSSWPASSASMAWLSAS